MSETKDIIKLRPDLAFLPLEDEVVVFSEEAQCIIGLNASAAHLVRRIQAGIPVSTIERELVLGGMTSPREAAEWISSTLEALGSHGMLANAAARTIVSTETREADERRANRIAVMPPYAPFEAAAERRYRLLGTCARIRFAMLEQAEQVDAVIGHLATDNAAEPTVTIDIDGMAYVRRGPIRSYIYRDGKPLEFTTGLHRLAPAVKAILWQLAVNAHDFLFYFHAGVVGSGGSCILLPAAAGSGKSSLTAALTKRGFGYFSDEVALVEPATFRVPPVPLALCVKSTGWDVIARYYPEIRKIVSHQRMDGKIVRYIPPPAAAIQHESALVSHIVFPRYSKGVPTELKPIARSEAVRRLLEECLAHQRLGRENVVDLIRWIAGIDCYALTFSSLDEAVELVAQATARKAQN